MKEMTCQITVSCMVKLRDDTFDIMTGLWYLVLNYGESFSFLYLVTEKILGYID
jgi:hypothetical protein